MKTCGSLPTALLLCAIPGVGILTTSCTTPSQPVKAASTQPLLGTSWRLTQVGSEVIDNPPGERAVHIVLNASSSGVTGHSGCNRMFGQYVLDGATLRFGGIGGTRMFCQSRMELEQKFLVTFEQVAGWKIEGSTLQMLDATARSLATFETP